MHASSPIQALPTPRHGWFWNPYFQIFLTVLLTSGAQILLKLGADPSASDVSIGSWLGVDELANGWTWLGILAFVSSFGSWLYALRFLPLGLAFSLTNGVHILVPLGSWLILHERLGPLRIAGICVIIVGILLMSQSVAHAEEKYELVRLDAHRHLPQLALVAGQIYLKRAMTTREHGDPRWTAQLAIGITTMTVWFLLWLGAMARIDLSQLMPMEGISPLLIVLGAMMFLRERLDWKGWSGVALTCVGVLLVSMS